jgi:2'-5' RNA ligase
MGDRLFLALWPPAGVCEELAAALPGRLASLKWQPPHRWHITLAFLGDRDPEAQLRRLEHFEGGRAESLRLRGAGTFGPVVWVGVETTEWLPRLAVRSKLFFGVDERRFQPHLTVARARSAAARRESHRAVEALQGFVSSAWLPRELTLVRSTLGPQAAYEVMGRRALEGA